jgi:hypothetical protein
MDAATRSSMGGGRGNERENGEKEIKHVHNLQTLLLVNNCWMLQFKALRRLRPRADTFNSSLRWSWNTDQHRSFAYITGTNDAEDLTSFPSPKSGRENAAFRNNKEYLWVLQMERCELNHLAPAVSDEY